MLLSPFSSGHIFFIVYTCQHEVYYCCSPCSDTAYILTGRKRLIRLINKKQVMSDVINITQEEDYWEERGCGWKKCMFCLKRRARKGERKERGERWIFYSPNICNSKAGPDRGQEPGTSPGCPLRVAGTQALSHDLLPPWCSLRGSHVVT